MPLQANLSHVYMRERLSHIFRHTRDGIANRNEVFWHFVAYIAVKSQQTDFDNTMASNININVKNAVIFITVCVVILYFTGIPLLNKQLKFINMKELLSVSIEVAERGGIRVKTVRESSSLGETSKGKTKEGVNDVLTAGDLQSHLTMMNGFKLAFPGLKVSIFLLKLKLVNFLIDNDAKCYG